METSHTHTDTHTDTHTHIRARHAHTHAHKWGRSLIRPNPCLDDCTTRFGKHTIERVDGEIPASYDVWTTGEDEGFRKNDLVQFTGGDPGGALGARAPLDL